MITIISLGWPIALAILFFALASVNRLWKPFLGEEISGKVPIIDLVVFKIEVTAKKILFLRVVAFVIACMFVMYHADRDYAAGFPNYFDIHASFDDDGIESALSVYPPETLVAMKVDVDRSSWPARKSKFLNENVSSKISQLLGRKNFFARQQTGCTKSSGKTFILVERTSGWQNYRLTASHGNLLHDSNCVGNRLQFRSMFKLDEGAKENEVSATFADIFWKFSVVAAPHYRQYGVDDKTGAEVWGLDVTVLTKMQFFPTAKIVNSVYLVRIGTDLVPVGSAQYVSRIK